MEPIFLPIPDACRVLGVGRSKLYELITAGDITIRKIGRKTLIAGRPHIVCGSTHEPQAGGRVTNDATPECGEGRAPS